MAAPIPMRQSTALDWLTWILVGLSLVATFSGLLWSADGEPFTFTTLRGTEAWIHGRGLYRLDTVFTAGASRGTDLVTLVLGIPLLVVTWALRRRGSVRAGLLHAGALTYFLYVYASYSQANAYNPLFLVYVALFSASFFGLVRAMATFDADALSARFAPGMPRRGPAAFMLAGGAITLFVWGFPLLDAMLRGQPPALLDSYTTMVTYGLDLALITPACFVSGTLILRGRPLGYLVAFPLLGIILLLAPAIASATVFQMQAGITFSPGEVIGPITGFLVLGGLGLWVTVAVLRRVPRSASAR